jgi:hypothetical protein
LEKYLKEKLKSEQEISTLLCEAVVLLLKLLLTSRRKSDGFPSIKEKSTITAVADEKLSSKIYTSLGKRSERIRDKQFL